ncbi:MAG TPA: hypothetical protein VHO94_06590 [Oscillospiraceae bacterium]|nr:hypothetical protein [Oscillospiraceae bacterium]
MNFLILWKTLYAKRHTTFNIDNASSIQVYACGNIVNIEIYEQVIAQLRFATYGVEAYLHKDGLLQSNPYKTFLLEDSIFLLKDIIPKRLLTLIESNKSLRSIARRKIKG